jgi:hypothetical protein
VSTGHGVGAKDDFQPRVFAACCTIS